MKTISILGSTGSIGTQTLDVIRHNAEHFYIHALSAGKNISLLKEQIIEFRPNMVSVLNKEDANEVKTFVKDMHINTTVYSGDDGLNTIAKDKEHDLLVVALVGSAGLKPTYTAISKGTTIALACKEVLVSAGDIIMSLAKKKNVSIIPIDSEHAALKQCLSHVDEKKAFIKHLTLTASGGPFWNRDLSTFSSISKTDALKHPNWEMGSKITIDSATMMNKGLEVIEAHHLFGIDYDNINVAVHPQSIVHSLVEFIDGNMLAHLGPPDMRYPIQYALSYPKMIKGKWPTLKLTDCAKLEFFEPNFEKFPLLLAAYECGKKGGNATTILNAANEVAVNKFLNDDLSFVEISDFVHKALNKWTFEKSPSIDDLLALDAEIKHHYDYSYC